MFFLSVFLFFHGFSGSIENLKIPSAVQKRTKTLKFRNNYKNDLK